MMELSDKVQVALVFNYATPDIDESELEVKLEVLGDEMWGDNDSSYLDDAMIGPLDREDREPRAENVNKVINIS